ncbi:J domain-containing protein [Williamsia sterculiae]|uniref:DnaJ domain-containing protein n=1 Tax=Williamsia sterculiae TaxID=1344003 RepID=A0A1N7GH41_9NOCA|nr:DnaJ domain-containing protein [Williamsia sterculiae]SIS11839.1 DnaJ domain-containing protein [Williamsia sterculiae]
MIDSYPLQWPSAWPRTEYPKSAKFKTPFSYARDQLLIELDRLGATDVVISRNMMVRQDGLLYAKQRMPDDRGVAVYFTLNDEQQCIPCDKWLHVHDNLQAIRLTVEALRSLERWGAKEMVNAAFRGFKALPAEAIITPFTAKPWHEVLEVSPTASRETIRAAYRSMLMKHHPDHGGSAGEFQTVQRAYEQAASAVGGEA